MGGRVVGEKRPRRGRSGASTSTNLRGAQFRVSPGPLTHSAARRIDGTPLSQTEFTNIDPLGRVLASRQTTDGLAAMNFAYQYAVGGALSAIQYPSGRWVTYTINGANRASAVRNGQSGTSGPRRASTTACCRRASSAW